MSDSLPLRRLLKKMVDMYSENKADESGLPAGLRAEAENEADLFVDRVRTTQRVAFLRGCTWLLQHLANSAPEYTSDAEQIAFIRGVCNQYDLQKKTIVELESKVKGLVEAARDVVSNTMDDEYLSLKEALEKFNSTTRESTR